jgi:hypothetical protein
MGRAAMAPETMATRCSPSPESHSDSRRRSCCISARMASLSWTVRVRQGAQGKASGGSTCSSSEYSSPHESRTSWPSKPPNSCARATCVMWGGSSRFLRTGCQGRGVRSANPTQAALGAGRKLTWIVGPPSSGICIHYTELTILYCQQYMAAGCEARESRRDGCAGSRHRSCIARHT